MPPLGDHKDMINTRHFRITRTRILNNLQELASARPHFEPIQTLHRNTTAFFNTADEFMSSIDTIKQDKNLTRTGQAARITAEYQDWNAEAIKLQGSIEHAARITLNSKDTMPTLPAPEDDLLLLEAKLGNARADARMLLDRVDTNDLPTHLAEIVQRTSDPTVQHLLLSTDWGENYIRSRLPTNTRRRGAQENSTRGTPVPLLEWAHHKQHLTYERFTPEQQQTADSTIAITSTVPDIPAFINEAIRGYGKATQNSINTLNPEAATR